MTATGEGQRIDNLAQEMRAGFERIQTAIGNLVNRTELELYVRKAEYNERGQRVDGELDEIRKTLDKDEGKGDKRDDRAFQVGLFHQAQRFWWVPLVIVFLKPEALHGLANLLGAAGK